VPLYAPPGQYAWDFWLVPTPDGYHLFHLQAPRRLPAGLRHFHASVGHAFSHDLTHWEYRGTALAPGPKGEWDDQAIWTGSILERDGRYWFLYTALERRRSLVQRIGLAVSDDLQHFAKHPANPVMCADARWYAKSRRLAPVEDWRDPFLFPTDGRIGALVTATAAPPADARGWWESVRQALDLATMPRFGRAVRRTAPRSPAGRGCLALATSGDFSAWEVHPPLLPPGRYSHLECPQLFQKDGLFYIIFSTLAGWVHPDWARESGAAQTGVHGYAANRLEGPYEPVNGNGVILGDDSGAYVARAIPPDSPAGPWRAMAWLLAAPGSRKFCGKITSPFELEIRGNTIKAGPLPGE